MSIENNTPAGRPRGSARPGYSFDVKLWKVSKTGRKSRPWRLRWVVAGKVHGDTFTTSALAESRRSELWQAMNRGAKRSRSNPGCLSPRYARRPKPPKRKP